MSLGNSGHDVSFSNNGMKVQSEIVLLLCHKVVVMMCIWQQWFNWKQCSNYAIRQ